MKELSESTTFPAKVESGGREEGNSGFNSVTQAESGAVGSSLVFLLRLHKARK